MSRTLELKGLAGWKAGMLALLLPLTAGAALDLPPANVELFRLDNGMEVLFLRIPGAPMAGMNVQVKAGSAYEDFRTSGMSHMLEHLLFNGSERYTQRELYDAADRLGAYNNANTSRFYTNFMMLVPSAEMEAGMELQCQMLFHSIMPLEKFEKERGIVLEELAQSADDPNHVREQGWEEFLFAGTSFDLPTLGTASTIRHMERDEVWRYYKDHYKPNNMLLSIVGGFDPAEARAAVERHYGSVAAGPAPVLDLRELDWNEDRSRARRSDLNAPRLRMAWPAPDMQAPDYLAAELLAWSMGDPRDGILPLLLFQAGLPPLGNLSVVHHADPGFGRFELQADLPFGMEAETLVSGLKDAMRMLQDYPFPAAAIDQRILDERTAFAQLKEKPHYFGLMQASQFVHQGFERSLARKEQLAGLGVADLSACAATWLGGEHCVTQLLYPGKGGATRETLAESPDDREWRRGREGLPAVLIEGSQPSEVFALQAVVRGRSIWEGPEKAGAINLIHHLMKEGAAGRSATELQQRIRSIGAKLTLYDNAAIPYDDHYTSSSHSFLRIECLGDYWQEACSLATDLLLHPTLDEAAFQQKKKAQLQQLQGDQSSARSLSRSMLNEELRAGHPSALPPEGTVISVGGLELQDLRAVHRAAFRPGNLILSVVGPVAAAPVADLLDELCTAADNTMDEQTASWLREHSPWLGDVQAGDSPDPQAPALEPTTAARELSGHIGGEMNALRLATRIPIQEEDGAALRLLFTILSDRLAFDLREERGWAYSIGCWASPSGAQATLEAYMGTRTENREQALKELRRWLTGRGLGKLGSDELDKARGGLLGRSLMRELASINQAWHLAMGELGGNPDARNESTEALRAVNLQDLDRVRGRYLKELPWLTVVVD